MADGTLLLWLTVVLSMGLVALALYAAKKTKRVKEINSELVRVMKEKDEAVEAYKKEVGDLKDQKALISSIGDKVDAVDRKVTDLGILPDKIDRMADVLKSGHKASRKAKPKITFDKLIEDISKCKKSLKIATPSFPKDDALIKAVLELRRTIPVKIISQSNGGGINALTKDGVEVAIADGADMSAIILDSHKVVSAESAIGKDMVADPEFEVVTDKGKVEKTSQAFDSLWEMAEKL